MAKKHYSYKNKYGNRVKVTEEEETSGFGGVVMFVGAIMFYLTVLENIFK